MQQCSEDDDGAVVEGVIVGALNRVEVEREGLDAADMGPVVRGVIDRLGHPFLGEDSYEGCQIAVDGRWSCW